MIDAHDGAARVERIEHHRRLRLPPRQPARAIAASRLIISLALIAASGGVTAVAGSPPSVVLVLGRGIGLVQVGDTQRTVRSRLGSPSRVSRSRGALGSVIVSWRYPGLSVDFDHVRVAGPAQAVRVRSASRRARTASGVGVGTSAAALEKAFPHLRCAFSVCLLGDPNRPLSRVTAFHVRAGRVVAVQVAITVNT